MIKAKTTCIWDLSGTLFRPQPNLISPEKKPDFSFFFLMWAGKKQASYLDSQISKLLNDMGSQKASDPTQIIRDRSGTPLPEILCAYLAGRVSSQDALERTLTFFESWAPQHLPPQDHGQLRRMIETFFDPKSPRACMQPIEAIASLFREMVNTETTVYILSNWDTDSFNLFYEKNQKNIFEGVTKEQFCISGQTGFAKPQRGMFSYLIEKFDLIPEQCFFIDDQPENLATALDFGIEGFQCSENRSALLKRTLKNLRLL